MHRLSPVAVSRGYSLVAVRGLLVVVASLCFWTVVLKKTLESLLDCKEIQPVHPKGDQSWVFIGRNDAEAETPILWPPHAKSWLIGKESDGGRDWGQEEKGDDRGWDGWMSSPTQHTWVWVNSRSWWWTERPGVLWFMRSQRVGHDWATELNWTELILCRLYLFSQYLKRHGVMAFSMGTYENPWCNIPAKVLALYSQDIKLHHR